MTIGTWTATINPDTGEVSTTVPQESRPGSFMTFPVVVHYPDTDYTSTSQATITVQDDGTVPAPSYNATTTQPGDTVTLPLVNAPKNLNGTTFSLPDNIPDGWKVSVSDTGEVTVTPGKNVTPGTQKTFDITAHYPDGTTGTIPAVVAVVGTDAENNNPLYAVKSGKPHDTISSAVDTTSMKQNTKVKYTLNRDKNTTGPHEKISWDAIHVNPDTGEVTVTTPADILPGSFFDVPILATYKDKSVDRVNAPFVISATQALGVSPAYAPSVTTPGTAVISPVAGIPADTSLRDSAPFAVPSTLNGWKVTVDNKGNVTATPPDNATPGDTVSIPVTVTYKDGSTDIVHAPFSVRQSHAMMTSHHYDTATITPGEEHTQHLVTDKGKDVELAPVNTYTLDTSLNATPTDNKGPHGETVYEVNKDGKTWTVYVTSTGDVVTHAPDGATAGDSVSIPVTVTYKDGSTNIVQAVTTVKEKTTRDVEFSVKVVYDDTLPAGEEKVTTPGKKGVETLQPDGTWKVTTPPVEQILTVGTKPKTVTETSHVPTTVVETTVEKVTTSVPTTVVTTSVVPTTVEKPVPTTVEKEVIVPTTVVTTKTNPPTTVREVVPTTVEKPVLTTITNTVVTSTTVEKNVPTTVEKVVPTTVEKPVEKIVPTTVERDVETTITKTVPTVAEKEVVTTVHGTPVTVTKNVPTTVATTITVTPKTSGPVPTSEKPLEPKPTELSVASSSPAPSSAPVSSTKKPTTRSTPDRAPQDVTPPEDARRPFLSFVFDAGHSLSGAVQRVFHRPQDVPPRNADNGTAVVVSDGSVGPKVATGGHADSVLARIVAIFR